MKHQKRFPLVAVLVVTLSPAAADWPTYRGDAARTGYTPEALPEALSLQWTYRACHAPQPAWPRESRMRFDRAPQPVANADTVFFGSSADGKLHALDAATGRERWAFFTDAPIRFAPVLWRDRVFVASDDGVLYCLSTRNGSVLWRKHGGPRRDMVLGNGHMISRWPARGGPMVRDGVLYFGAGIWTAEGIYLHALDPETGATKWINDSSGAIEMEHPHSGNRARSGVSIQGYLAADHERVFVPTGRGIPATFDRETGKFVQFREGGKSGNAALIVGKDLLFTPGRTISLSGAAGAGALKQGVSPNAGVLLPDQLIRAEKDGIASYSLTLEETKDSKGNTGRQWTAGKSGLTPVPHHGLALIAAGNTIVSGGEKGVSLLRMTSSLQAAGSMETDGGALGLAASHGRLFVSTDRGVIHCYAGREVTNPPTIEPATETPPLPDATAAAASKIIRQAGVTEGYCLDLGCGDGSLALALARQTKLRIVAVDSDPRMVALARERIDKAGLYGSRITVIEADPAKTPLPNYFANLVVSHRGLKSGLHPATKKEAMRVLRPYGGIARLGQAGALQTTRRGPLEGAGEWTHQYSDAANSCCSDDLLAKAPLGMLWFTDLGITMPDRHGRGPAPLFKNGIMVVEGIDGLYGVDAYNGRVIWNHPIREILKPYDQEHLLGTAGTHGNMCVTDDGLFVRHQDQCIRIDFLTGEKRQSYRMPGGKWGFIACKDGILYGSRADPAYIPRFLYRKSQMDSLLTQSDELFAFDVKSGRTLWSYQAGESIRHNAIAIGCNSVFLIDATVTNTDRLKPLATPSPATSTLICLDARTGREQWKHNDDIYGTTLVLGEQHKMLLMGYQYSQRSFQFKSETGNRLTGFHALTGEREWDRRLDGKQKYISRPMINGATIHAQPWAWDLMTGEPDQDYAMKGRQPGGCGNISGSRHLLLYRSGPLSYIDLTKPEKLNQTYGPMRPGCWINIIPAGGLVLMPDATEQCSCSYLMKVSVALQPM